MTKRKPNQMVQMNTRMREELRKRIEVEAKKQGRSLNGELVHRLNLSFVMEENLGIRFRLDEIIDLLKEHGHD